MWIGPSLEPYAIEKLQLRLHHDDNSNSATSSSSTNPTLSVRIQNQDTYQKGRLRSVYDLVVFDTVIWYEYDRTYKLEPPSRYERAIPSPDNTFCKRLPFVSKFDRFLCPVAPEPHRRVAFLHRRFRHRPVSQEAPGRD